MSKTILSILIASLLLVFVAGCGGGGGDSASSTNLNSATSNIDQTDQNTDTTTQNIPPIAVAGEDQTVPVGSLATLDGAGSSDPDGNYPLTYTWEIISTPDGSGAVSPAPDSSDSAFSFTPDLSGEYMIQLVVTDSLGMASDPVYVAVSTSNSRPVAYASIDPLVLSEPGTLVQLNGSGSYDQDGDPITYAWIITEKPADSYALLSDPTAVNPTFMADVVGTYKIELIVTDNQGLDSEPIEVGIAPVEENVKPVADAGNNDIVTVGVPYYGLDGSGSSDPNGDPLTYSWNITSTSPKNSQFELSDSDTVNPIFTPYTQGSYDISLVVNDGSLDSDPSNIEILALDADNLDDPFIKPLAGAVFAINGLADSDFYNPNMRNALTSKIFVVIKSYLKEGYSDSMLDKLTGDISGKMDGCDLGGEPDGSDWINNCEAQQKVYPFIKDYAIPIFKSMS